MLPCKLLVGEQLALQIFLCASLLLEVLQPQLCGFCPALLLEQLCPEAVALGLRRGMLLLQVLHASFDYPLHCGDQMCGMLTASKISCCPGLLLPQLTLSLPCWQSLLTRLVYPSCMCVRL